MKEEHLRDFSTKEEVVEEAPAVKRESRTRSSTNSSKQIKNEIKDELDSDEAESADDAGEEYAIKSEEESDDAYSPQVK